MKRLWAVAVACCAFSLVSIGCKDDNPAGPSNNDLIGKWVFSKAVTHMSITGGGMSMTIDTTINFTGNNDYIELRSDNTYTVVSDEDWSLPKKAMNKTAYSSTETGTWSLSGSSLTTISTEGDTTVVTVSQSGSSATFSQSLNEYDPDLDMTISGTTVLHATKQ
ncbi:MAG: hypothetical protein JW768_06495 [Chitinispirillaceae bacterium]|nr:hypothetical protein [Chitinispirillaceae bacterium]